MTLSATVTREGTVSNLEILDGRDATAGAPEATDARVEELRDAVSHARFEPATRKGLPVAVNMVWLVAHTTVRGKHPPLRGLSKSDSAGTALTGGDGARLDVRGSVLFIESDARMREAAVAKLAVDRHLVVLGSSSRRSRLSETPPAIAGRPARYSTR